jgi:hypothetical protein
MRLSKSDLRSRTRELRDLVNSWDPIGVMADPDWPRDEYDCLVSPLLRNLEAQASAESIAATLHAELTGHFGLDTSLEQCRAWARDAIGWYASRWPGSEPLPAPST